MTANSAIENSKNYNTQSETCQTKNEPDEVYWQLWRGARDV